MTAPGTPDPNPESTDPTSGGEPSVRTEYASPRPEQPASGHRPLPTSTEPAPAGLGLHHDAERSLQVTVDGREIVRYVYRPWDVQLESPRPFFHPLRTLGGDLVSLFRPHDHVWHRGIAWSLPHVGEDNFWGGPTYVTGSGYQQLDNDGSMDHEGFARAELTRGTAVVEEALRWHTQQGVPRIAEHRRFAVGLAPEVDAWALAFESTMTNLGADAVAFGSPTTKGRENAGYGGFFWRGPRSFTGGRIELPGTTGADELMGERAPWAAFVGQHDDHGRWSTLTFVDDESNAAATGAGGPTRWFLRSDPFAAVCPAPFFSTEVDLDPGAALTLRYAVVIADGDRGQDGCARLAEAGVRALASLTSDEGGQR
ncbi:PmoA family protein [Actinoalloteichus caeruleus]|uniref:DUF6807 domain-containing protein n=1 Tax=Actinoalloteichus cyanogriseus TaxID=2893586 RepID=UPI003AAF746B